MVEEYANMRIGAKSKNNRIRNDVRIFLTYENKKNKNIEPTIGKLP